MTDIRKELKPIEGAPYCGGCNLFDFDPENKDSHYYLDESLGEGECVFDPKNKIRTTSHSRGCSHWQRKQN